MDIQSCGTDDMPARTFGFPRKQCTLCDQVAEVNRTRYFDRTMAPAHHAVALFAGMPPRRYSNCKTPRASKVSELSYGKESLSKRRDPDQGLRHPPELSALASLRSTLGHVSSPALTRCIAIKRLHSLGQRGFTRAVQRPAPILHGGPHASTQHWFANYLPGTQRPIRFHRDHHSQWRSY